MKPCYVFTVTRDEEVIFLAILHNGFEYGWDNCLVVNHNDCSWTIINPCTQPNDRVTIVSLG